MCCRLSPFSLLSIKTSACGALHLSHHLRPGEPYFDWACKSLRARRPTPAFSGAVNGIAGNHENCASRPPLQRLVRRALIIALFWLRVYNAANIEGVLPSV